MTPALSQKHQEIKSSIERLFATKPDWISFYREVMGLNGLVRRAFPTHEDMAAFEETETYHLIQWMLAELRKLPPTKEVSDDARVITIRIPHCLHEALRIEAFEHRTSMNKLCISKLMQFVDAEIVPPAFAGRKQEAREEEDGQAAENDLQGSDAQADSDEEDEEKVEVDL